MQALVEKLVVLNDDLVDCAHFHELVFELVEVWLEDFEQHVVKVVLAELKHLVAGPVSLCEHLLDVVLLGGLVDRPGAFQGVFNVLLEQEVPEY